MAKHRITSNKKPLTQDQKQEALESQTEDFTSDYTLDYCANHFLLEQITKNNSKATQEFYKRFFKKYEAYLTAIHKCTMKDVSVQWLSNDVQQAAFMAYLNSLGVNIQTVNAYLRGLRSFGNFCEKKGYITTFTCPIKEKLPPVRTVYTNAELAKLRVKPSYPIEKNFLDWRTYCAIGVMLNCGARSNTLLNMKIEDVDLDNGFINLNVTKTNKVERLKLDDTLKLELTEWINWRVLKGAKPTDYLFCNDCGEQMARSSFNKSIKIYNNKRGVDKTSIHLFRHTFAKMWLESGGDIFTLQRVLGHSELEMVKRYANLYGEDVAREMKAHSAISQLKPAHKKTLRSK